MIGLNPRQKKIVDLIEVKDFVSVKDLSTELNVSLVTIRKDLTFLEEQELLYRVHGGASKRERYAFEKPILEKEFIQVAEKVKIAQKAASLVSENDFIVLASGSTMYYLAEELKKKQQLTVCTPSLRVSMKLAENNAINIIQIGGDIRKSSASVIGSMAEKTLQQFSSHLLFLGVDGIDTKFGISTSNLAEAQLNQVMMKQSDKVIILADASKVNRRGFGKIANIEEIDTLITNGPVAESFLKEMHEFGVEVIIV